jgi:4-hydroxybenzoate polyprenyltransferase/phosphoserine phosphatase
LQDRTAKPLCVRLSGSKRDSSRGWFLNSIPLVVDLDGTLIQTDMLHETAVHSLKDRPLSVFKMPAWLAQGKAHLKERLADDFEFSPATLPYNQAVLSWLEQERSSGRTIILATASDQRVAQKIAEHLGCFDAIMASDGHVNLAGTHKADALVEKFGAGQFDYAGNSSADLPVWKVARQAIVVSDSSQLAARARKLTTVAKVLPSGAPSALKAWRKALRAHQWLKNVLLLAPLFAAHKLNDIPTWSHLFVAFVAFCMCASSVYLANDLLDLESDRQHPRKKNRPFAAGHLPIWQGVLASPLLTLASLALATTVGAAFVNWLIVYFVVTTAYSVRLKRVILMDALILAFLYTLRVLAGAAAAGLAMSFWLLAFSGFLFLSLAFVKRYAELQVQLLAGKTKAHGRGYLTTDAPLVQMLGITSGYAGVLVLALYLNSEAVIALYKTPQLMWSTIPVMVFWVSWIWMCAHRGQMHDDPLVFAIKDRPSLFAGLVFAVLLALGSMAW